MSGLFSKPRLDGVRSWMQLFSPLVSIPLLLGCAAYTTARQGISGSIGTGSTFAIYGLEGRWAGAVIPLATGCGSQTQGIMTITSHGFGFDPFGSTFVINGTISDAGALQGTLKRVVSGEGSRHVERSLNFVGNSRRQDGVDRIEGRLESGRCTWQVALQRA